jgi:signal transduction histidine kinase
MLLGVPPDHAVRDDGRGIDVARALDRGAMRLHMGLDSMRARLQLTGGQLDIDSAPERGASIRFRIPIARGYHPRRR